MESTFNKGRTKLPQEMKREGDLQLMGGEASGGAPEKWCGKRRTVIARLRVEAGVGLGFGEIGG